MENRETITWNKFKEECEQLANLISQGSYSREYASVYGIPRGGTYVAMEIANLLDLPLVSVPDKLTIVVDDITDSGKTLNRYKEYDTAVLHRKEKSEAQPTYSLRTVDKWIAYPWEEEIGGIEDNIARIIEFVGDDPTREGVVETPKRVAKAYHQWFAGYHQDPKDVMKTFESANDDQIVVVKNIDFYSHCEHHIAPFYGQVHVGYLPDGKVLGVSKFSRLVDVYARRLQIQETMTDQIAKSIMKYLQPKGVGVIVEGIHLCMRSRGVEKQNSVMTTSVMLGDFREKEGVRQEFLQLISRGGEYVK